MPSPRSSKPNTSRDAWRPPSQQTRDAHSRRLFMAVAALLLLTGVSLWLFVRLSSGDSRNVRLGDQAFVVGNYERVAAGVDRDGPLFFNDLVREDDARRPLVLTHIKGKDFAALNALAKGSISESCVVEFDRASKQLVDPCTKVRYGLDGLGIGSPKRLDRFVSEVNQKNVLTITLNEAYPETLR